MKKILSVIFAFSILMASVAAAAPPPIEAYGDLPEIRSVALSPDGSHFAFLARKDGKDLLLVYQRDKGLIGGVDVDAVKARSVYFAGPDYVVLRASETTNVYGYEGEFENSGAFSYSLKDDKVVQLLMRADNVYTAQSGMGRIIGFYNEEDQVLMPAYSTRDKPAPYDLFHVSLATGNGGIIAKGTHDTIDWIADRDGVVLARADYSNSADDYEIFTQIHGTWEKILEDADAPEIPLTLAGVKADKSALIITDRAKKEEYSTVYELGFDGKRTGPVFHRDDADIDALLRDFQRNIIGVIYSGLYPQYEFYDDGLTEAMVAAQQYFGQNAVTLESWSEDFNELLLYVAGATHAGDYYVYDRTKKVMQAIGAARPDIKPEDIAPVLTIQYKARDGLPIPALLTLPPGAEPKNLPLIVLPHGGPERHDVVGFDWMAQYFASRGYMVLQPEFRGSDGFGVSFRDAGRGEWGGKMQDDITDGVEKLISSGRADPNRVCIVGASYGGYSALAGGAFTPDLYKCVAAIAPVSDIPLMLKDERREHGKESWVVDYWKGVIGDPKEEQEKLERISPANHADAFQAPVLLLHGKDDLTVPIEQSEIMERALKAAGKNVQFIKLKGEDHYLSQGETRLEVLKALDVFVEKNIGAKK